MSTSRTRILPRALAAATALVLGTAAALAGATDASAVVDSFEVTAATGSGAGTLAEAITLANADPGHSKITFSPAVVASGLIAVDDGGLPEITADLHIEGPSGSTLVVAAAVGGANDDGIRAWGTAGVAPGFPFVLSDLTIRGFFANVEVGYVTADLDRLILESDSSVALGSYNAATTATDVTITGTGSWGVYVLDDESEVTPASFDNLSVAGHDNGIYYDGVGDADASFTDATIVATTGNGFQANLEGGAHIDLEHIDASGLVRGLYVYTSVGSATITGSDFHDSGDGGAYFYLQNGSEVELKDSQVFDNDGENGAGIEAYLYSSTLEISGTIINGNDATDVGGGIYLGDMQEAGASLDLVRSTVTGNSAGLSGGGIALNNIGTGAATDGVSITDSEITNNDAGVDGGGLVVLGPGPNTNGSDYPTVFVERTTIADNEAVDNGGGVFLSVYGAVAYSPVGFLNSTIAGNLAGVNGGAAYVDAGVDFSAYFVSTTIAGNSSGIFVPTSSATVEILYSILADNGGNDLERDDATIEIDWSLVETPQGTDATDDIAAGDGNFVGVDPQLGTLANNGGETRTMRPALTSPAVNAGDPALTSGALRPEDQRGGTRLVIRLDMGAVELTTLELGTAALAATGTSPIVPAGAVLLLLAGGIALVAVRKRVRA